MVLIHAAVRQDDDISTLSVRTICLYIEVIDGFFQRCILIICDRDSLNLKSLHIHILDLEQVCIGQDRIVNPKHLRIFFFFL